MWYSAPVFATVDQVVHVSTSNQTNEHLTFYCAKMIWNVASYSYILKQFTIQKVNSRCSVKHICVCKCYDIKHHYKSESKYKIHHTKTKLPFARNSMPKVMTISVKKSNTTKTHVLPAFTTDRSQMSIWPSYSIRSCVSALESKDRCSMSHSNYRVNAKTNVLYLICG